MSHKLLIAGSVLAASAIVATSAESAVIVEFDNSATSHPFRPSELNGKTSLSGSITDPDFNGGTATTLTLSNPVTGVTVTTPTSPDFSTASASFFGTEGSGFGVGDTNLGRFTRGEAFTISTTHAMMIDAFWFHEWNGDEDLHISWTEGGASQSEVFSMSGGSGAGSNRHVPLSGIQVDANTSVVITNVSPSTANSSGRLRVREMQISLVPEPAALSLLGLGGLGLLRRRRT